MYKHIVWANYFLTLDVIKQKKPKGHGKRGLEILIEEGL